MRLLILNNTSRFSTVLDAFLKEAKDAFEAIYVVFPGKYRAEDDYEKYKNVTYITPKSLDSFRAIFFTFLSIFQVDSIRDYILAVKKRKFNPRFIKKYVYSLYVANVIYILSNSIVNNISDKMAIFSTWYDTNAIAAAKVSKSNPKIFTASYAHSYEVDFRKNKFTAVVCDRFKEKYIDAIYFISENVMKEYIKLNKDILLHTDKYCAVHFGSRKKCEGLARSSEDNIFRIVTCSGISPVKRLDIFAEALTLYKGDTKIEWTVIGTGPDLEKVKAIIENTDKRNVDVIFKGSLSNDLVHQYYVNNAVDLFVNVSISEGLPVSIMEAMSYGIPVLATDVGGNHEIVTSANGYPVPAEITPESLCEQLTAIVNSQDDCNRKRDAAFCMWDRNYRIDKNIAVVIERLKNG